MAVIADAVGEQEIDVGILKCEALRGGVGLPMRQGTEIVGVIEFYNRELREPDKSLVAALDNIACQITQPIYQAVDLSALCRPQ